MRDEKTKPIWLKLEGEWVKAGKATFEIDSTITLELKVLPLGFQPLVISSQTPKAQPWKEKKCEK